jgi:hypothetical protein
MLHRVHALLYGVDSLRQFGSSHHIPPSARSRLVTIDEPRAFEKNCQPHAHDDARHAHQSADDDGSIVGVMYSSARDMGLADDFGHGTHLATLIAGKELEVVFNAPAERSPTSGCGDLW